MAANEVVARTFDYDECPGLDVATLDECSRQIRKHVSQHISSAIKIGEWLARAHHILSRHGNGTWCRWVESDRCGLNRRTAANYMTAWERYTSAIEAKVEEPVALEMARPKFSQHVFDEALRTASRSQLSVDDIGKIAESMAEKPEPSEPRNPSATQQVKQKFGKDFPNSQNETPKKTVETESKAVAESEVSEEPEVDEEPLEFIPDDDADIDEPSFDEQAMDAADRCERHNDEIEQFVSAMEKAFNQSYPSNEWSENRRGTCLAQLRSMFGTARMAKCVPCGCEVGCDRCGHLGYRPDVAIRRAVESST